MATQVSFAGSLACVVSVAEFFDRQAIKFGPDQNCFASLSAVIDCRKAMTAKPGDQAVGIGMANEISNAASCSFFFARQLWPLVQVAAQAGKFHNIGIAESTESHENGL
jgi:hypothetical protein